MREPARTDEVRVRDANAALEMVDIWRRGDLGLKTRRRDGAEMRRLFEETGALRVRAWRPTGGGKELVELVIRQREGRPNNE